MESEGTCYWGTYCPLPWLLGWSVARRRKRDRPDENFYRRRLYWQTEFVPQVGWPSNETPERSFAWLTLSSP